MAIGKFELALIGLEQLSQHGHIGQVAVAIVTLFAHPFNGIGCLQLSQPAIVTSAMSRVVAIAGKNIVVIQHPLYIRIDLSSLQEPIDQRLIAENVHDIMIVIRVR